MSTKVTYKPVSRDKKWISKIAKGSFVSNTLEKEVGKVVYETNSKFRMKYPDTFTWFIGMTRLKGPWGDTRLIWPTTPMSRKYRGFVDSEIQRGPFHKKKIGGS